MKRRGQTGIWTFVCESPEGKIIAIPDWSPTAKEYEFDKRFWEKLSIA